MKLKKLFKKIAITLLILIVGAFIWLSFNVFPVISGYGSKNLCSAVYLQHRNLKDVIREDLGDFPLSLGKFVVNRNDSTISGSVFGIATRKAIYRKGCGCTLLNDFSDPEVRNQQFLFPSKPIINSDSIYWPYGNKIIDSIPWNINRNYLQNVVHNVMNEKTLNGKSTYTRAVLILYDGNIIAEQYAPGVDKNTVMLGWSVSKSLMSSLIGILVNENRLSVDEQAPVAEWTNTEKKNITIKDLLQQTSGIDFIEAYSKPSNVTKMLFSKGDMATYAASLPLKYKPGSVFNYSGGNSNILSRIIRKVVGENDYSVFPYKELFYKINAYSFLLEPDASGTYVASSYSYATARDFARFGLLYFNDGLWNGQQILSPQWIKESVQPSDADKRKHYGYQFWLNGYDEKDSTKNWYPDVPADMFFADGYGGQNIFIIPSKKLVVLRFGLHPIDANKFLKEVIQSIQY